MTRMIDLMVAAFKRRRRRCPEVARSQLGMTLIEIMVVVAIIGLLMGTVGVVAYRRYKQAKLTNAKQIIANVQQALGHAYISSTRVYRQPLSSVK